LGGQDPNTLATVHPGVDGGKGGTKKGSKGGVRKEGVSNWNEKEGKVKGGKVPGKRVFVGQGRKGSGVPKTGPKPRAVQKRFGRGGDPAKLGRVKKCRIGETRKGKK